MTLTPAVLHLATAGGTAGRGGVDEELAPPRALEGRAALGAGQAARCGFYHLRFSAAAGLDTHGARRVRGLKLHDELPRLGVLRGEGMDGRRTGGGTHQKLLREGFGGRRQQDQGQRGRRRRPLTTAATRPTGLPLGGAGAGGRGAHRGLRLGELVARDGRGALGAKVARRHRLLASFRRRGDERSVAATGGGYRGGQGFVPRHAAAVIFEQGVMVASPNLVGELEVHALLAIRAVPFVLRHANERVVQALKVPRALAILAVAE